MLKTFALFSATILTINCYCFCQTPDEGKYVPGPPPADVSGRVMDKNGKPVADAMVQMLPNGYLTTTDKEGNFLLRKVNVQGIVLITHKYYDSLKVLILGKTKLDITLNSSMPAVGMEEKIPAAASQTVESNDVEVKLYLPAHEKNSLKPTDKLIVYFMTFPGDSSKQVPKKVIATKVKENIYRFSMPQLIFWHVAFNIGNYWDWMLCVDNKNGAAVNNTDFNIRLFKSNIDHSKPEFLPPCIIKDDEQ